MSPRKDREQRHFGGMRKGRDLFVLIFWAGFTSCGTKTHDELPPNFPNYWLCVESTATSADPARSVRIDQDDAGTGLTLEYFPRCIVSGRRRGASLIVEAQICQQPTGITLRSAFIRFNSVSMTLSNGVIQGDLSIQSWFGPNDESPVFGELHEFHVRCSYWRPL